MISATHVFSSRDDLAAGLAKSVAEDLNEIIKSKGHATLAVSGGNTPALFFGHLSVCEVPWHEVTVTLVDERQVDEENPRSNARLVRLNLLGGKAAAAQFVPLHNNPEAAKLILDVVVLGMGADGHTASFFPDGDHLEQALDAKSAKGIITMTAPNAGEPRLTFTLAKLLAARNRYLHIEGEEKRLVLEDAKTGQDTHALPIRAVIHAPEPLQVFWCP
jgi:6-phosphogluconolactonase